jgi:hypothetical protein
VIIIVTIAIKIVGRVQMALQMIVLLVKEIVGYFYLVVLVWKVVQMDFIMIKILISA